MAGTAKDKSPDELASASPSYEQARDELTEVVRRLEAGGVPLEESLALWERGEALARICQEWLDGARARMAAVVAPEAADSAPSSGDHEDPPAS